MIRSLFMSFVCFCSVACGEEWTSHSLTVGGKTVTIDLPGGWLPADIGKPEAWMKDEAGVAGVPFAGAYCSTDHLSYVTVRGISPSDFPTSPDFADKRSPGVFFAEMLSSFRQNSGGGGEQDVLILDAIERAWSNAGLAKARKDADRHITRTLPLAVFDESKSHFSRLGLLVVTTGNGTPKDSWLVVTTMTWVLVKDRLLAICFYQPFEGKHTYDELRTLAKESVVRLNGE